MAPSDGPDPIPFGDRRDIDIAQEMKRGQFPPHGKVLLHDEGDLLFYSCVGPFNVELIAGMAEIRARSRATRTMPRPRHFVNLLTIHENMLMTPEALEMISRDVPTLEAVGTALVADQDVVGRGLMVPVFREIWKRHDKILEVFEDLDSAIIWARAAIAAAQADGPGAGGS